MVRQTHLGQAPLPLAAVVEQHGATAGRARRPRSRRASRRSTTSASCRRRAARGPHEQAGPRGATDAVDGVAPAQPRADRAGSTRSRPGECPRRPAARRAGCAPARAPARRTARGRPPAGSRSRETKTPRRAAAADRRRRRAPAAYDAGRDRMVRRGRRCRPQPGTSPSVRSSLLSRDRLRVAVVSGHATSLNPPGATPRRSPTDALATPEQRRPRRDRCRVAPTRTWGCRREAQANRFTLATAGSRRRARARARRRRDRVLGAAAGVSSAPARSAADR